MWNMRQKTDVRSQCKPLEQQNPEDPESEYPESQNRWERHGKNGHRMLPLPSFRQGSESCLTTFFTDPIEFLSSQI